MPIYEYECEKCHESFERIQSIHDPPISKCPQCAGKARRIVSRPAIVFKGSGFHVTDYTSKKEISKPSEAPSADKPKSEPKSETGSSKAAPEKKSKSSPKKEG